MSAELVRVARSSPPTARLHAAMVDRLDSYTGVAVCCRRCTTRLRARFDPVDVRCRDQIIGALG